MPGERHVSNTGSVRGRTLFGNAIEHDVMSDMQRQRTFGGRSCISLGSRTRWGVSMYALDRKTAGYFRVYDHRIAYTLQ